MSAEPSTQRNGSEAPGTPRSVELPSDESTIRAICEGALAITEPLEIRETLVRIVDAARRITGAQYGACGVRAEDEGFVHFIHSGMDPEIVARVPHPPEGKGLLGLILREEEPIRLAQISSHEASVGFPPNHPTMTSFLGQPVIYRGRNVGNIYLTEKEDGTPFDEQDELALGVLAGFAGVAISNAHQFHQVNTELTERGSELDHANQTLQALSSRVLWMLESERRLIAQELHDGIGQVLAGAILAADAIVSERTDPLEGAERLTSMLRDAVKDVRRISHGLRPTVLDELGPVAAIRDIAEQLSGERPSWISFSSDGTPYRLPEPVETVIFRVAQEGLTNAVRHSGASRIEARMEFDPTCVHLRLDDNGIGMPSDPPDEGLGLAGMRERAALVNGVLSIESGPGRGVHLTLEIPIEPDY